EFLRLRIRTVARRPPSHVPDVDTACERLGIASVLVRSARICKPPVHLQDQIRHGRIFELGQIVLFFRHDGGGYRCYARLALLVPPSRAGYAQIIAVYTARKEIAVFLQVKEKEKDCVIE